MSLEFFRLGLGNQWKVNGFRERAGGLYPGKPGLWRPLWLMNVIEVWELLITHGGHPSARLNYEKYAIIADRERPCPGAVGSDNLLLVGYKHLRQSWFSGISLAVPVKVIENYSASGGVGLLPRMEGRKKKDCKQGDGSEAVHVVVEWSVPGLKQVSFDPTGKSFIPVQLSRVPQDRILQLCAMRAARRTGHNGVQACSSSDPGENHGMEQRRLGTSGIVVSEICMGTMTFGTQADRDTSFRIMDHALEQGVDFYDCAELYPVPPSPELVGLTESWVGDWLATKPRDSVIIATKVAGAAHGWFNPPVRNDKAALDRNHIRKAVEGSLERLKTDYIDLYQVHWPDHGMRPEDTLGALDELVREGKVRAIGVSNEDSYGLMKSLWASEMSGFARYDTVQNNFSLNNRRFEDELSEVSRREKVSLLPYSPLAGGVLSGKYNGGRRPMGARFTDYMDATAPRQRAMAERFANERCLTSTARFMAIAEEAGVHPVTMAVAWSKQHDFVASTIVGATSVNQLEVIFDAAGLVLKREVLERIDQVSREIPYPMG